jgi:hypothetical protein
VKRVRLRSILFDHGAIVDVTGDGSMTIRGQSCRRQYTTGADLELTPAGPDITFCKMSSLMDRTSASELQVAAEVCRLGGLRDVYVMSLKRLKGESWNYSRFVVNILRQ